MNPQFRTKVVRIWKCRKCHKDYDNYKEASDCCADNIEKGGEKNEKEDTKQKKTC